MSDDLFDVPPKREEYGPAHARRTDPDTSHRAAREITAQTDSIRAEVERWAMARGADGFIDEELSAAFDATDSSSYRTRRGELTRAGRIVDTGRRRMNDNARQCIVWVHQSFRHDFVMEKPLTLAQQLAAHANRLDEQADWSAKNQGRVGLAAELHETAALIRKALAASQDAKKATGDHG